MDVQDVIDFVLKLIHKVIKIVYDTYFYLENSPFRFVKVKSKIVDCDF